MLVDLNMDLDEAQNPCSQLIANLLTKFSLINLMHHFRKRLRFLHLNTWTQVCQVTVLMSSYYYILVTNQCPFNLVGIRYMRNYSSYRFDLWLRLLRRPTRCHAHYL